MTKILTPAQLRAARAMLGWSARILAEEAGVHITTVQRLERDGEAVRGNVSTLNKIQQAVEAGGVQFLDAKGPDAGPGVRLNAASKQTTRRDKRSRAK